MGIKANAMAPMCEVDCGCGCHIEGKNEQCLSIRVLLHMEAAHPEIEEPTIEVAEEIVAAKAYVRSGPGPSARSSPLFS